MQTASQRGGGGGGGPKLFEIRYWMRRRMHRILAFMLNLVRQLRLGPSQPPRNFEFALHHPARKFATHGDHRGKGFFAIGLVVLVGILIWCEGCLLFYSLQCHPMGFVPGFWEISYKCWVGTLKAVQWLHDSAWSRKGKNNHVPGLALLGCSLVALHFRC